LRRAKGILSADARCQFDELYQSLNPLRLRRTVERELDRLWALAVPAPTSPGTTTVAPPFLPKRPGGS
jgi:hypothetical protein